MPFLSHIFLFTNKRKWWLDCSLSYILKQKSITLSETMQYYVSLGLYVRTLAAYISTSPQVIVLHEVKSMSVFTKYCSIVVDDPRNWLDWLVVHPCLQPVRPIGRGFQVTPKILRLRGWPSKDTRVKVESLTYIFSCLRLLLYLFYVMSLRYFATLRYP